MSQISFTASIFTGIISGLISGYFVSEYFRKKDLIRSIIDYANQTADHAYEIKMEAQLCLDGKDTQLLQRMLEKSHHRGFAGKIEKPLQQAIAGCNEGLHRISQALNETDYHTPLFIAINEMPDRLLNIWNAIVEYERRERKKQKRDVKILYFLVVVVVIICSVLIINEYGYLTIVKRKWLSLLKLIQK